MGDYLGLLKPLKSDNISQLRSERDYDDGRKVREVGITGFEDEGKGLWVKELRYPLEDGKYQEVDSSLGLPKRNIPPPTPLFLPMLCQISELLNCKTRNLLF